MAFESFGDFLHMGGYAFYVWLSYGVGLTSLFGMLWLFQAGHKKQRKDIVGFIKREKLIAEQQANNT
ncbi:MAG: heme exporter protein CcmD [Pseudomonadota bacterium]